MEVRDNGLGVKEGEVPSDRSFGILGMRERAAMFGGNLNVYGLPGKGCAVYVRIPFVRDHQSHQLNESGEVRSIT